MSAPSEKGAATSFRELSLDLNPSSITQRLARSTCCQRPLRTPPERRGSVRTTNPALVRIRLSPKPFKLIVNRGALSTRPDTDAVPAEERCFARDKRFSRGCRPAPCARAQKPTAGVPELQKDHLEVKRLAAQPFEEPCPRILAPWPEPTFKVA